MTLQSTLSKEAQKVMVSFVNDKERKKLLKLMFNWSDVVGNNLALTSLPKKISKGRSHGKVLSIEVPNSAIGTEIYYMKKEILAKVNSFLGTTDINDLVLATNYQVMTSSDLDEKKEIKNTELQEEEKKNCDVGDDALSESLVELLKAIKTK